MTNIFNVSKEQLKKILIKAILVMILAVLAYFSKIMPEIISNPLVLTISVALIDWLQEFFTDEQGKFGGVI